MAGYKGLSGGSWLLVDDVRTAFSRHWVEVKKLPKPLLLITMVHDLSGYFRSISCFRCAWEEGS